MNELMINHQDELVNRINLVLEQNGIYTNELEMNTVMDLDSLTQISILVGFENEFDFEFLDGELIDVPQTYEGLVQLVLNHIAQFVYNEPNTTLICKGGEDNEKKA